MQKKVEVEYFALLMQEAKVRNESIITTSETVEELFHELKIKRNFSLNQNQVRASVNQKLITQWKTPIASGDRILFIPPLVGG